MSGKGSKPRPVSVPASEFARRWDQAFRGSTIAPREARAAPDGPALGGRPNAKVARHALDRMAGSADRLTAALLEIPCDLRTEILGKS
jgi:hypothetical protein